MCLAGSVRVTVILRSTAETAENSFQLYSLWGRHQPKQGHHEQRIFLRHKKTKGAFLVLDAFVLNGQIWMYIVNNGVSYQDINILYCRRTYNSCLLAGWKFYFFVKLQHKENHPGNAAKCLLAGRMWRSKSEKRVRVRFLQHLYTKP